MDRTATTFANFYQDAYESFDQTHRVAGSIPLDLIQCEQDSHETLDPSGDAFVIGTAIASDIRHAWVDVGDGRCPLVDRPGILTLQVAGTDALFHCEGPHTMLLLAAEQAKMERLTGEDSSIVRHALERLQTRQVTDPLIGNAMRTIWRYSRCGGHAASLMVDGLFCQITARLLEHAEHPARNDNGERALSARDTVRVTDYVEAHLDKGVTATELAALLEISPFHFIRLFKTSTGRTPYAYVIERRVSRAERMLTGTDISLAEIALACGFCSQAHLTSTLSRLRGITPGRLRREASVIG